MEKIWVPNNYESSNLFEFERFLEKKYDLSFSNYIELHEWSIKNLGSFWESISEFYKIQFDEPCKFILNKQTDLLVVRLMFQGTFLLLLILL